MVQDTSKIKADIISFIRANGPSLPVHIASKIQTSILFTSAFLSELLAEKRLKLSNMRVGSSPLYLVEGQEPLLEKFGEQHLKSKEKEAFLLLKEKRFLEDSIQHPAIRVALREIKDFAIPFRRGDEGKIFWRYFIAPESEFKEEAKKTEQQREDEKAEEYPAQTTPSPKEGELDIFDSHKKESSEKKDPKKSKSKTKKKRKPSRKKSSSANEKFFNEVKEFLTSNSIELKDIMHFAKNEFVLLVEESGTEKIFFAFNKKKIGDKEIAKASKKSREMHLPYIVLSRSGALKKIESLIEDLKSLDSVKSLDNS